MELGDGGMISERIKRKVVENRLRRAVHRQGYMLVKSRTHDPRSVLWGWYILNPHTSEIVAGDPQRMTIEEVERWVTRPTTTTRTRQTAINLYDAQTRTGPGRRARPTGN